MSLCIPLFCLGFPPTSGRATRTFQLVGSSVQNTRPMMGGMLTAPDVARRKHGSDTWGRTPKISSRRSAVSTCSNFSNNSTLSLLMNKNSNHQLEITESRQQKINFDLRSLAGWAISRAQGNFSPESSLQLLKERVSWMEKAQYKAALKK